jgi:Neprosin/Neprosin activation peptide
MPDPRGIASLNSFIDSLDSSSHDEFAARADSRVAHEDAFNEMRDHILGLYRGVSAAHSFTDEHGSIFDCIPIEQQPALRGSDGSIPELPDLPPLPTGGQEDAERVDQLADLLLSPDRTDWYGNVMNCPEGTIPMRRVTLEDMTRFATVRDFMQKGPQGAGRPPREAEPATVPVTHRWAHAYQNVNNGGGHSFLSLWSPSIGANQVFSLSQHWYIGGSGPNLQTAECGWQVYPALYGDSRPHLFTYWTADNYALTGCYNMTCSAFVQVGTTFAPGMALGPVSVSGGAQYNIELAYWLTGGRWYLYFNGTQGSNIIGYYPVSLYRGGALATQASEIDYGGETTGTTSFPPMGSGAFANQGWQRAAYQRAIGYWPPQGGAMINANLTASQAWPNCYTAEVQMYAPSWSETLWFGGPGGNC